MLRQYHIDDYIREFSPTWNCEMPEGCPPADIFVPQNHLFYRLAHHSDRYDRDDFMSYAETCPNKDWGERLPLAIGLSIIDNEIKARKKLKLPMFRTYKGLIQLSLNPTDGVVKQTGVHTSHYTWWRTKTFKMENLKMISL